MQITKKNGEIFLIKAKEGLIQVDARGVEIEGLVFSGPGEYERKGIFVEGVAPDSLGTIFLIHAEDISICYAANIRETLSSEAVKSLGDVDILIVSIGQEIGLSAKDAEKTISTIDPRIVLPARLGDDVNLQTALGLKVEESDVYKVKKADLPAEDRQLILIK